ncbi:ethanolamine utilization protein EutJ [uncultured Veillonella sp.]|uniref:ethanolamine utilization protein EutJ n=1 Tax=uncultured Veillonella sp. TaxID=159268 RepID=UPI0025FAA19C|nr:ethanolamine utilization protein EutJ [uncultured Veillonella sp.]MDY3973883.1 ethanolamine utilization protein EutJ [Veillonella caviae]
MKQNITDFSYCDQLVDTFEKVVKKPIKKKSSTYYVGVDLGTAFIVIAVLDENREPVAGAYQFANVVKDGMVVDYVGAVQMVREMKEKLEATLGTELIYAAAAIPPGTEGVDGGAVKHVVQGAGFEITKLLDEPTAANAVLKITNGAIVDIGGGTTGISIFKDGKQVYVADEPTGGTHFSLVIAGAYQMEFDKAESFKRDPKKHRELLPILTPVIDKVGSIIEKHIAGYDIDTIYLVGGTCCLTGIESALERKLGLKVVKPKNPMFVTPLGIALECTDEIMP